MDALSRELVANEEETTPDGYLERFPLPIDRDAGTARRTNRRRRSPIGREVTKVGMAATLTTTILTGFRILRPMRLHPIAGGLFVAFALAHLLLNDKPPRR